MDEETEHLPDDLRIGIELERIFLPDASGRREKVRKVGGRFAHYTSAENVVNIIRSKSIWMRNTKCMNDYMEVVYGHKQLIKLFNEGSFKQDFRDTLNPLGSELADGVLGRFDQWWNNIEHNTYICSISEHDDSEDSVGRLSMWRAYGRLAGKAALIFRLPLTPGAARGLNLLASPVSYLSYAELETEFRIMLRNVRANIEYLKSVDVTLIDNMLFFMLIMTAVCLKHVGFKEEKEWRVIYLPYIRPSDVIKKSIEVIDGFPQPIYKIPLVDSPERNIVGIEIKNLVDRIIIGPSVFPGPMFEAFATLLDEAGVENSDKRIVVSHIPLRT